MFSWILPFLIILGLLIFVHELGHFLAAKRSGIKVERFSLGFPPNIIKKRIGETEYCIGLIPLGGYVKMKGDVPDFADDKSEPTGDPGEFMSAPVWKRAIVIAAGPIMNIIAAILLFMVMVWAWGNPEVRPNSTEIGSVVPDTPAFKAGLKEGDKILTIDGRTFQDFEGIAKYIKSQPEKEIVIVYRRDGKIEHSLAKTLKVDVKDSTGVASVEGRLGIDPVFDFHPTNAWEGFKGGFESTYYVGKVTLDFLWKLITHQESMKMLGGPIMIADQAGKALKKGLPYLINLAAFLSINLGILNILPIPVLDGGHLVFLSIEAIRRKPISFKKRLIWQQIGMGLLLLLMVFVTYNDIARLITGGQ
jgi:regulator of sigma E protease